MNWRDEAMAGRGLFTLEEAKRLLGKEVDFYERATGDKRPGKISRLGENSYQIVDLLTFKRDTFSYAADSGPVTDAEKASVVKALLNQGRLRRDLSQPRERRTMEVLEAI